MNRYSPAVKAARHARARGVSFALLLLLAFGRAWAAPARPDLPAGADVVVVMGEGTRIRPGTVIRGKVTRSNARGLGFRNARGTRYFVLWGHIRSVNGKPVGPKPASAPARAPTRARPPAPFPAGTPDRFLALQGLPPGAKLFVLVGRGASVPEGTRLRGKLRRVDARGLEIVTPKGVSHDLRWAQIKEADPAGRPSIGARKAEETRPPEEKLELPPLPEDLRPMRWHREPSGTRRSLSFLLAPYFRDFEADMSLGVGILRGDTTYRIGGRVKEATGEEYDIRFPLSELDFPLNVQVLSGRVRLAYGGFWEVEAEIRKSISDNAGEMRDSDWGINYYDYAWWMDPDSLDIYSESKARLDALMWDVKVRGFFLRRKYYSSFAGVGYLSQRFKFTMWDLDQWYPSFNEYFGYDIGHLIVPGEVLRYQIRYSIPYIEVGEKATLGKGFSMWGSLAFSPFVRARDLDEHLLRSMESRAKCSGTFFRLNLDTRYTHPRGWFAGLRLDYTRISAKGESDTNVNGLYDHTIEQKIRSDQVFFTGFLGFTFGGRRN